MFNNLVFIDKDSNSENNSLFVYFQLGEKHYAIHTSHTVEILKLAKLDHPQKLPAYIVGLLNYSNLTINVIDLRSALSIPQAKYSVSNQLIVLKTEESIFAVIVDEVLDVINIPPEEMQAPPYVTESNLIKMLYRYDDNMVSIIDLYAIEKTLRENQFEDNNIDYELLLPQGELDKKILQERGLKVFHKEKKMFLADVYNQDQFMMFSLEEMSYCFNLKYVKELVASKNVNIVKLPFAPEYIEGVINLRGDFITVINLKEFLSIRISGNTDSKKIIVLESKDYKLAILVDEIQNIMNINHDKFIHKSNSKVTSKYIMAEIVEDQEILNILNMEKLFNDEKLFVNIE